MSILMIMPALAVFSAGILLPSPVFSKLEKSQLKAIQQYSFVNAFLDL